MNPLTIGQRQGVPSPRPGPNLGLTGPPWVGVGKIDPPLRNRERIWKILHLELRYHGTTDCAGRAWPLRLTGKRGA